MQKIKNLLKKLNILKRLRQLEQNQSVFISAHNTLNTQFRTLLDHYGLVLVVSKKGKLFIRKNGRKK